MKPDPSWERRFRRQSPRDRILAEIDALAVELREAGEATVGGRVPIAARADVLRAQDAHRRAVVAWGAHELDAAKDALRQSRGALDSARALLARD
jgi:hypothetical protein